MTLRPWAALAMAAGLLCAGQPAARAQAYPERSVRVIISFAAGGTIDVLGRILAQKLTEVWGQSVLVENRGGAGGNLGAVAVAQSAPDGYTLHFGAQSLAVNVTLAPVASFDPTKNFDPIMLVATALDVLMVPPDSPYKSVKDLIDDAKARPGAINYASLGVGSSGHLASTLFGDLAGIKLQHVPYSSYSQAATDFMSGRTQMWITTLGGALPNIKSGKMRALAVSGKLRSPELPDLPTFVEQGVGFSEESSWYAFFAPKGTPKPVIDKVNADLTKILAMPDIKAREASMGYRFIGGSPEKLEQFLQSEIRKWAEVAKNASLSAK